MLSISGIDSPNQAVSYYEKDDYYVAGGAGPGGQGEWYGRGAGKLGLAGTVDREQFRATLEGKLPNGVELGRWRDGERSHYPGWDLTFSAPKSVSLLVEIAGDERLREAHQEAVKAALDWLEEHIVTYRQQGFFGVRQQLSGNLVAALFQHDTSREQDPQLHTHSVVINATERGDQRWVSVHGKLFYEYKMAGGNIYRAELAMRVQELGYEIERTGADGRFEVSAVPADMLAMFQARRDQIEAAMQERGLAGAEDAAHAALLTRGAKQTIPRDQLVDAWTERARSKGYNLAATVDEARAAGDQRPTTPFKPERAVYGAIERLAEPEAVFSNAELIRWSLANAIGRGRVDDITDAMERLRDAGRLQQASLRGRQAWTTPRAKEQERRILESLRRGRGQVQAPYQEEELDAALSDTDLSRGQRAAVTLIATTRDRFTGVLGRSGTGKTRMLRTVRELLETRGYQLHGMAQNSEAARKLADESKIESGTVRRHMKQVERDLRRMRGADKPTAACIRERYAKQVWIMDEASQSDSGLTRSVTFAAERLGARLVMVGDVKQLGAIGAGKPFELMLNEGMQRAEMDEIRRQKNPEHLKAIRQVYAGDIDAAMATLEPHMCQAPRFDDRVIAIVDAWRRLNDEQRKDSFILTAGNQEKAILNEGVRQILRSEGKLAGEHTQHHLMRVFSRGVDRTDAGFYTPGDQVRFPRELANLGVRQGEYLKVVAADRKASTVTLQQQTAQGPRLIEWDPQRVAAAAKHSVELFRPRETSLAPGEVIRWTRNSKQIDPSQPNLGLANGQQLTVMAVSTDRIEVATDDGQRLAIDTRQMSGRHWEHAYASTVYSSQGGTAKVVLVNAESDKSELFNQKAFLVGISRQKESLTLFTDDKEKFAKTVKMHLGDKSSALEGKAEYETGQREGRLQRILDGLEQAFKIQSPPQVPERGRDQGL